METPSKSQAAQSLDAAWSVFRKELNDTGYGQALKGWMQALRGIYKEDQIPVVSDSVCLALGHLRRHKSRDAPLELGDPYKPSFCQLAAYMHLLSAFGLDVSVAKLHDPAFTKEDKAFLHGLGFMIPESPEEALLQLRFDVPTLVVMWFLPFPVIELILKINWDKRRLGNIVMIGHKIEGWLDDE
ncbi:sensitivity to red-light reduced protein [Cystobasidiomycetes sp. EMM_F5]